MQRSMDALMRGVEERPWRTLSGLIGGGVVLPPDSDRQRAALHAGSGARSSHASRSHRYSDDDDAARETNPLFRIGKSLSRWTDGVKRAVTGDEQRRDDDDSEDRDRNDQ